MNAANPNKARDVFLAALKMAPEHWDAYLNEACGDDGRLRGRVQHLLVAHREAGSFLEPPAPSPVATVDEPPLTERPGTVIGPYKLLEQIGEGGFGIVFMAEQQHPVRRKVALKVLKPGMDTRQVVARFEAERQALALMDHPNIAHVFDGGETASGRPYFVMELVRGIPITDFCDRNQLPVRERLELYVMVCQAVQHAHQRGIIHRDLKPSNVLVTLHDGQPVVKVIDFGIAKATGQQLTEKTLFTNFAQMIGTPLYMSPEQAELSGLDIDTRSDIYSLGVLLYELLTGTTPVDQERLRTVAYEEIRRIIREEEPAKPSTRISTLGEAATAVSAKRKSDPRRLAQLCRGELDWIVMKALEKDRNRRYESASALAADVQRYLNDETVQACPPSPWYRLRKFVRRNRRAVVMAGFLFALLVIAVTVLAASYVQVQEALQEKTQALEGQQEALQEKTQALEHEQDALRERTKALEGERQTTYYQSVALAERQLSAGNVGRAEEFLNACPPDLRGWEWHFLKRQRYGNAPPLQHLDTVYRVAFSPDGRQIASGCFDGTIQIWDAGTGSVLHTLHKGGAINCCLTYSSNGQYLAAAHNDGVVRVWKATTGELLATSPRYWRGSCPVVAFSPDGRTLASGLSAVKLWDLGAKDKRDADRPIRTLSHRAGVAALAFSPDGGRLLTACGDGTVKTWDVATGQETSSFRGDFEYGDNARFSPDNRRLAWACGSDVVKVWDTATGHKELDLQSNQHRSRAVAFSPDGKRIALAGFDGTIRLLEGSTGRETLTIYAHPSLVADVAFSPDGYRLVTSSYDHTVRIWDATPLTGDPQARQCVTLTGHTQQVDGVAFSPDGRWLASASRDRTVKLWELSSNREPALRYTLRGHRGYVRGVAFSPDSRTLASGSWDNTVKLWDLQARQGDSLAERRTIPASRGFNSVGFSPDGRLLAIGTGGGIAVYDPATGKEIAPFKRTPAGVPELAFGPDGRLYSCGASDPTIKVWDVAGKEPILTIRYYCNPNSTVAVSPDGRLIASAGGDRNRHVVKIWDAKSGTERRTLHGHAHYIWKVAFSPDGRYLASGSWDSTVKVWDLVAPESAEPVTLRGHAGFIESLAFSPDGQRLASASGHAGHGEVKVWDAALWDFQAKRGR
jgi:WD40 repeat protein/serine/threonine protein kinase